MFNSIRGIVSAKNVDAVFILTGDIEWEIAMPANDVQEMPLNSECRIFTWLYHREDQMKLFGFLNDTRRCTFLELLKVEGIGPKAAVRIMGGISQTDLEQALENADIARLEAVPGLGKKTAQKMVLSLKGKLVAAQNKNNLSSPYNDLADALVDMGYERRLALVALEKAHSALEGSDLWQSASSSLEKEKLVFKEAIIYLSGA
ncbi:MAG: Holliday junction branch migration protein RuvA [Treponema sp.]|nr:Holliday junction branch migration protein RuvA [Treponema sp.]